MVKFDRYPHVNDLVDHYARTLGRDDVAEIIASGIQSSEDAAVFCKFIWQMVGAIYEDEEKKVSVFGSIDNTEMLPDISYEITKLMKSNGFFAVWESVSREEME